jgi:hypothetical protein
LPAPPLQTLQWNTIYAGGKRRPMSGADIILVPPAEPAAVIFHPSIGIARFAMFRDGTGLADRAGRP